jgi:hypothetical protein
MSAALQVESLGNSRGRNYKLDHITFSNILKVIKLALNTDKTNFMKFATNSKTCFN